MTTEFRSTDRYILKSQAREMLGASYARVNALIGAGLLSTRQIPGGYLRVRLADVEALLSKSTRPATAEPVGATA